MRTVHLLVNVSSRRGASDAERVRSLLRAQGVAVEDLVADGPSDVAASIESAGPQRLIAVGGDGLVHRALPALAGTEIELGLVPSGTGNDFARALGIPRRRRAAVQRSLGRCRRVDLLRVDFEDGGSALAASVVTAGFSGRVTRTANERSFPRGQLKYTVASFSELRRLRSLPLAVSGLSTTSGAGWPRAAALVAIANTRFFGGGMAITPEADPTDGSLDITVVGHVAAWQLALVLPTVFIGQHVRHPLVVTGSGHRCSVDQPEEVWADGELIGQGPFDVTVVDGALRVAAL